MDGVRIPSTTLSSSRALPPPSQGASSGGSFRAVLTNASTNGSSESRPANQVTTSAHGERAEDRGSEGSNTASANSTSREDGTVGGPNEERSPGTEGPSAGTTDPTEANAGSAVAAGVTALTGAQVAAAPSLSGGYLLQNMAGAFGLETGRKIAAMEGTDTPAVTSAAERMPGKQDRSKTQAT